MCGIERRQLNSELDVVQNNETDLACFLESFTVEIHHFSAEKIVPDF